MTFETLGLHPDLLKAVQRLGFIRPTPIQEKAIGPVLGGRDLIGRAQTGTGKTAAFILPVLHRLLGGHGHGQIRVLVLTPTRELAQQVVDDAKNLAKYTHFKMGAVFGGVGMGPQAQALRSGAEIIVATPGRLLDHMSRGYVRFQRLQILVLDEADRMLDMGFLPDLKRILAQLPKERQTLFFCATMPSEIQSLAHQILRNPVMVQVESRQTAAVGITHAVYPVSQELKTQLLLKLIKNHEPPMTSVLVFTRTKHKADQLQRLLKREGLKAGALHGDRTQSQRTQALERFRSGEYSILVATDLAARGLDVQGISHVINYNVPGSAEDYIHRVGRTGRAQAVGDAFTFMARDELGIIREVERTLGKPIPRVTLSDFDYHQVIHEPGSPPGRWPHARNVPRRDRKGFSHGRRWSSRSGSGK